VSWLLLALSLQSRYYWPVNVDTLASHGTPHTHVSVSGLVTLVRREADGDLHIKLVGHTGFVVAECVPKLPCRAPRVGERVTVKGISRHDGEHNWWEVHPVEEGP